MWLLITGLLLLLVSTGSASILAPYQVSIRSSAPAIVGSSPVQAAAASNDGSVPSKHICSGIIIKDKYILTTAGCVHYRDPMGVNRLINPGETFILAGNLTASTTGRPLAAAGSTNSTIRRNVVSVIPHEQFNATSGEHDIALLKLDRPLPLQNSSVLVQWIDLQGPPPNTTGGVGQTTTASTANNKVNENCFINIYNNSVGPSNYPYTVVRNVSFFDKWICDERSKGKERADGRCVEYRFGASQSCMLDPEVLRRSEERGTALVCGANFKLAAILAEINPPANAGQCVTMRRTTAFYTPIEPHLGWIAESVGQLYSAWGPTAVMVPPPPPGGSSTNAGVVPGAPGFVPGPGASWGTQQVAAAAAAAPGNPKSAAVSSFCSGAALKVILFNLFISLAVIYRFRN